MAEKGDFTRREFVQMEGTAALALSASPAVGAIGRQEAGEPEAAGERAGACRRRGQVALSRLRRRDCLDGPRLLPLHHQHADRRLRWESQARGPGAEGCDPQSVSQELHPSLRNAACRTIVI